MSAVGEVEHEAGENQTPVALDHGSTRSDLRSAAVLPPRSVLEQRVPAGRFVVSPGTSAPRSMTPSCRSWPALLYDPEDDDYALADATALLIGLTAACTDDEPPE